MNEERRLLERVMYRIPSLVISEHDLDLVDEIKELLSQPEYEADRRSDSISKLRNLRDIQGRKGNYDVDEYMRGLYNGLELSLSIFEDRGPDYKEHIAQPEQTEQEPLSEATINYYLERLGSHFKWDDGFIAGVKWAEKAHGIGGGE